MMNPTFEETSALLEGALGGHVRDLERLSGGASRITYSFVWESPSGESRPLILQQYRSDGVGERGQSLVEGRLLAAALENGVPVPAVVASGTPTKANPGWLVVERLSGETIPRKILRDSEWARARDALTSQCASALAAIHRIDPDSIEGLAPADPLRNPLSFLDALGEVRPALELGVRWLALHPSPTHRTVTVHGDFRTGNLLVNSQGLGGVLDWELAHRGDPAEDLGWLCARAWRFGGAGHVGGFGELDELLEAYVGAGGQPVSAEQVRWWEIYATIKWAVICALQSSVHLNGTTRSIELAAIGRRVCESEWDLFGVLGVEPRRRDESMAHQLVRADSAPFGRPTEFELLEAVAEYLETKVMERGSGAARFEARIARNVVQMVERQIRLGSAITAAHHDRLAQLGYADDAALAAAIRAGHFDNDVDQVAVALCTSARDQLLVANPAYLDRYPPASSP